MVPPLLIDPAFWESPENWSAQPIPEVPGLEGHVFFQTSGSTGTPKWIALSKNALLLSAAAVNRHLRVTQNSVWGLPLPIHHVGGFGVIARSYEAACDVASFESRWEPNAFTQWLKSKKVTHSSLVPTQVHDLVKEKLAAPPSLEVIVVGGGKLEAHLGQRARDLGWPVLASYGMTEACSQIATQSLDSLSQTYQPSPISILPIWDTRISGNGLLEISGPALFSGIVRGGAYHPRLNEWHTTSDRVLLTNNSISPLGRADFLVKVLGELVNPEEIAAEVIALSEGYLHSANFTVIALPDARSEHILVPVFEGSIMGDKVDIFLSRYNAAAAGFQRLKNPVSISNFPRTELGKLRRNELTQRVMEEFHD